MVFGGLGVCLAVYLVPYRAVNEGWDICKVWVFVYLEP